MKTRYLACGGLVAGLVLLMLAAANGASACFPLPVLSVQPRASGPVGDRVTVVGIDFAEGATEIRWNAIDGPLLGRGSAGTFRITVMIPQAEDGVYAIVALARQSDGSIGVKAVTPFELTSQMIPSTSAVSSTTHPSRPSASFGSVWRALASGLGGGGVVALLVGGAGFARRRRGADRTP